MGQLKKTLGLTSLVFYGVGTIIGAGIYSVIGAAAAETQYSLWLSFALAALLAFLTALSYAELSAMFPKVGGEYTFLRKGFPTLRLIPWLVGFLVALSAATTAATVALAFGGYMQVLVELPVWLTAAALLLLVTLVNILGIKESSVANTVFTCIEVSGLLLAIYVGLQNPGFGARMFESGFSAAIAGVPLIFFIYTGFEGIVNLSEESHKPERDIPRALLISLLVTTVLYILVALAVVALRTPSELGVAAAPLTFAVASYSTALADVIAIIALFATTNTALVSLVVGSRLLFGMARAGDMPAALAKTGEKRATPWFAAVVLCALATSLLSIGSVSIVASLSSLITLIAFCAVHCVVIKLRFSQPELARPFRTPFSLGNVPLLPVLAILAVLSLLGTFKWTILISALGCLVVGGIFFYFSVLRVRTGK